MNRFKQMSADEKQLWFFVITFAVTLLVIALGVRDVFGIWGEIPDTPLWFIILFTWIVVMVVAGAAVAVLYALWSAIRLLLWVRRS